MAKLVLSMDGLVLKEIPLTKKRLNIGRKPQNDVQIDNLAISGEHAAVVTILKDSFLEDLDSTNGTLVNGRPVKKHCLKHNDVIELGKYKLKYLNDPSIEDQATEFERVPEQQLATSLEVETGTNTDPQFTNTPSQAGVKVASIKVLSGSNAGKILQLTKPRTSLGKPGVQAAIISRGPQGYFIGHVEGTQFPTLNGKQVLDSEAHMLKDHDLIEIFGVQMEFLLDT